MKKKLRYIKIFEAFESTKLSKTLGYISDENSKTEFMNMLEKICEAIDFPISKLNDGVFQYLPYQKALKLNVEADDVDPEPKLVKFWFSKEGKFITTTGTDGRARISREQLEDVHLISEPTEIFDEDITKLKTGTLVRFTAAVGGTTNGYIVNPLLGEGIGDIDVDLVHIIHNHPSISGGTPEDYLEKWIKYGKYGWCIWEFGAPCDLIKIEVLSPKQIDLSDPNSFNAGIFFPTPTTLSLSSQAVKPSEIEGAHFALVLDFSALKKSEYEPISKTRVSRAETRKGATALIPAEEYKKMNIQRYFDEIKSKIQMPTKLEDLNRTIYILLGGRFLGFRLLFTTDTWNDLERFVKLVNEVMVDVDTDKWLMNKKIQSASEILRKEYQFGVYHTRLLQQRISEVRNGHFLDRLENFLDDDDKRRIIERFPRLLNLIEKL